MMLVFCDLLARTVFSPSEIPIGVITAALGAPVFYLSFKPPPAGQVLKINIFPFTALAAPFWKQPGND